MGSLARGDGRQLRQPGQLPPPAGPLQHPHQPADRLHNLTKITSFEAAGAPAAIVVLKLCGEVTRLGFSSTYSCLVEAILHRAGFDACRGRSCRHASWRRQHAASPAQAPVWLPLTAPSPRRPCELPQATWQATCQLPHQQTEACSSAATRSKHSGSCQHARQGRCLKRLLERRQAPAREKEVVKALMINHTSPSLSC